MRAESEMKKVLTIAGSDCSGGAGIQADLKTITAHKMYGMSAITALTAQNTMGVYHILNSTPEFLGQQLDCIFQDIYPDAVKIGMVSNCEIIEVIVEKLIQYKAKNVVVDPVMVSTSGSRLLNPDAIEAVITKLMPMGSIVTPNLQEAELLCGFSIHNQTDMVLGAEHIHQGYKGAILIKGGHLKENAVDLLYNNGKAYWYKAKRIDNPNSHGTGCTLSSAIACNLAGGNTLEDSVHHAKQYITDALEAMLDLGKGAGPLNHMCRMK